MRRRSYSAAARELNLTHGAISQRLRALELDLKTPLFRRAGNAMVPTPAAEALAAAATRAFADLSAAVDAISLAAAHDPLVVSLNAQFATRWLAGRLGCLETAGLQLSIRVEDRLADFAGDGVDAAIRLGAGPWPGVERALLIDEALFPVCSPDLAARHGLGDDPVMGEAPLLTHQSLPWAPWFAAMGVPARPARGLQFDDSGLLLDAAVRGLGVALARRTLVEDDLRHGRLVRAHPGELDCPGGVWLVWRADNPKLARIEAFRAWLEAETVCA